MDYQSTESLEDIVTQVAMQLESGKQVQPIVEAAAQPFDEAPAEVDKEMEALLFAMADVVPDDEADQELMDVMAEQPWANKLEPVLDGQAEAPQVSEVFNLEQAMEMMSAAHLQQVEAIIGPLQGEVQIFIPENEIQLLAGEAAPAPPYLV